MIEERRLETLGPADRIIQTLIQYTDHAVHNRPGIISKDARTNIGMRWDPAIIKQENDSTYVYRCVNKKEEKIGKLQENGKIISNGKEYEYRQSGIFPEVVSYLYEQISEIWKLDNEFLARWASWLFENDTNKDLKMIVAAFLLVQSHSGVPIKDGNDLLFDEDFSEVGWFSWIGPNMLDYGDTKEEKLNQSIIDKLRKISGEK